METKESKSLYKRAEDNEDEEYSDIIRMNNENFVLMKVNNIKELLKYCPKNKVIRENIVKAYYKINSLIYKKIVCAISGGSDSDVMMDIIWRCDKDNKVEYVWFDTGLEYQATKDHLRDLEKKYNVEIKSYKAVKSIPFTCRKFGQPFISKHVSEMMSRLQKHEFKWEDKPFDELYKEYPRCKVALGWWCNNHGEGSRFNIERNKWLKEFVIAYPPTFNISNKCCKYAKKDVIKNLITECEYDLNIFGVRKSEGGVRVAAYKSCFDEVIDGADNYRPLFYYKDDDKIDYEEAYKIYHSKCYSEYVLDRTGCAGCPFGREFEFELEVIKQYEPKLFRAANKIFGDSYAYTRKYREFVNKMNNKDIDC